MNAVATTGRSEQSNVSRLPNDALIIRLINSLNHLSRWITPIHDQSVLEYSGRRGEPSVKDVLLEMRDTEARIYALMYAIATEVNPDLDRVPRPARSAAQVESDRTSNALVIMSAFRRVRESSTTLLRALPDAAWERGGFSRTERDWTIRQLAEFLANHDREKLGEIDRLLDRIGARANIAGASRVSLSDIERVFAPPASRG
jgi:hypothetical protein